ncbi:MAG TPA: 4Fe-4S binding protein [Bacillota bacterium]|nr:4Fe-4S binding protein [Bacillota bacterium]HOR85921.1 4Fe-4S binding protein [Bacillota bacterium]HPL53794.1 4Fe-4S binding protein [Bacillota bacterium]
MLRKIIKIDEEKCNGCGLCVSACHEGAIGMVNGKAQLLRDDYCDGLGDCLPACPTGAISFEEREALPYDEEAVKENMKKPQNLPCGCPGAHSKEIKRENAGAPDYKAEPGEACQTHLSQWPVQIKLIPPNAPYFKNANLLIAADCAAYAYGNFHNRFMKNKITLIGCPKLDDIDYSEKLTAILKMNDIKSVTVVRMEVPCCGGLENAVKKALRDCGKLIQWQVVTISADGRILES